MDESPRQMVSLRRSLLYGLSFTKDRLVKETAPKGRLHRYQPRDRKAERTALRLLISKYSTADEKTRAVLIADCTPNRPCDSWICYVCRHRYWEKVRPELGEIADGLGHNDISFLTLVAGITRDSSTGVEQIIGDTRRKLERVLERWQSVTARGRFEVDCLLPGDTPTTFKRRTLSELGYIRGDKTQFIPHLHAVVVHPRVKRGKIRMSIEAAFPGFRRIKLSIDKKKPIERTLDNLVRYPLKFTPPSGTLPREKSKSPKTSRPEDLLYFVRMIERLGGLHGSLSYRYPLKP